ncbi:MAG: MATE family efflux transporter [Dehalococcoidia bacterium]|nr:MATE family efflux transporter [Dehalococcoidia bacterium]
MADGSGPQRPNTPGNGSSRENTPTGKETRISVASHDDARRTQPTTGVPLVPEDPDNGDAAVVSTATLEGVRVSGEGGRGGGRGSRTSLDLTTGSVPKKLFHQTWPQVAEGMLNVVDQLIDLVWAGLLPGGFRAIAGLGIGQSFTQLAMMARQGLDQSMRAMVSRAVGAKNIPLANHVVHQAFTLNAVYALFTVLIGVLLTDVFLGLIGASEAIRSETALFMRLQFLAIATMSFRNMAGAALQASSEVIVPLKATFITRVLHVVLSPLLMFGPWWFPEMGLAGVAVANVLAQLGGMAINFYVLLNGSSRLHVTMRGYRMDFPLMWRMIKIGVPASVTNAERAISQLVLLGFAAPFGDIALAAFAMTRRMEMLLNFGGMGTGQATGVMVGQNLGAGKPERAKQAVLWGLVYCQVVPAAVRVVTFIAPALLITIFTREPEVVTLGAQLLRLQVIAAFFMVSSMVFQQSFNTAGDTLPPMIVTLIAVWAIEIPLAWFLTHTSVGLLGVGYAAIAGMAFRNVCYVPYYFTGRWLRVKVI